MSELGTLSAFALVLIRTSALILSSPVLGYGTGFAGYKIGLIFTVSLVLFASSAPGTVEGGALTFGLLALREVLLGLFLGFLLQLVFVVVRVSGEMIGHEMGFMVARQVDPQSGIDTPLITSFYENLFTLAFLSLNGHQWMIRSLHRSFVGAPVGDLALGGGIGETVTTMFGQMFRAGLVFAAPVMLFLMLVSIAIGLLSRLVPHLNVLEVGFTARVLVALGGMFLFAPMLEPAMTRLHRDFLFWLERGVASMGA